ncbi:MAG: hypothetical protein RBR86_09305 [Pseudobdellovibrionaceae bacterium]|jgi:hypothetical protein|nr:hypothetical protein [Pseudobdellovibrionaceae bacterium]
MSRFPINFKKFAQDPAYGLDKMAEDNEDSRNILSQIFLLLDGQDLIESLDDMNMRGEQISIANDFAKRVVPRLAELIRQRDSALIQYVNSHSDSSNGEVACFAGASQARKQHLRKLQRHVSQNQGKTDGHTGRVMIDKITFLSPDPLSTMQIFHLLGRRSDLPGNLSQSFNFSSYSPVPFHPGKEVLVHHPHDKIESPFSLKIQHVTVYQLSGSLIKQHGLQVPPRFRP